MLVRERLAAGDSDAAVLAFVEARYGEFVLLRPRLRCTRSLLWLTPLLLLAGAAIALVRRARRAPVADRRRLRRRPALTRRAAAPRRPPEAPST